MWSGNTTHKKTHPAGVCHAFSPLTHAVHKYQLHISLDEDTEYHLQHYFADEYILDHDTYIRFTSLCAYRVPCGRTEPKWTAIKLVLII